MLNCAILSKYELFYYRRVLVASSQVLAASSQVLAASSQVLAARSELVYFFFVQTFVDFALSLPGHSLEFVFTPDHEFFLRIDKEGQEVRISSQCPTSAIASPHVKYVKGC